MTQKLSWKKVRESFEKKFSVKLNLKDWDTPELVAKYIEKYALYSSSAETKLLSTPELVAKYIEKYRLETSSAETIFSLAKAKVKEVRHSSH